MTYLVLIDSGIGLLKTNFIFLLLSFFVLLYKQKINLGIINYSFFVLLMSFYSFDSPYFFPIVNNAIIGFGVFFIPKKYLFSKTVLTFSLFILFAEITLGGLLQSSRDAIKQAGLIGINTKMFVFSAALCATYYEYSYRRWSFISALIYTFSAIKFASRQSLIYLLVYLKMLGFKRGVFMMSLLLFGSIWLVLNTDLGLIVSRLSKLDSLLLSQRAIQHSRALEVILSNPQYLLFGAPYEEFYKAMNGTKPVFESVYLFVLYIGGLTFALLYSCFIIISAYIARGNRFLQTLLLLISVASFLNEVFVTSTYWCFVALTCYRRKRVNRRSDESFV